MTARVSADNVKEIIKTSLSDDVVLANMVEQANMVVDTQLASTTLTDRELRQIELNLAAHFVAITEERGALKGIKMGDSSEFLSDVYGTGYNATRYGQVAMTLDSTGILAGMSNTKPKAQFMVV